MDCMTTLNDERDYSDYKIIRCDSNTDINRYISIIIDVKKEEKKRRIRRINKEMEMLR